MPINSQYWAEILKINWFKELFSSVWTASQTWKLGVQSPASKKLWKIQTAGFPSVLMWEAKLPWNMIFFSCECVPGHTLRTQINAVHWWIFISWGWISGKGSWTYSSRGNTYPLHRAQKIHQLEIKHAKDRALFFKQHTLRVLSHQGTPVMQQEVTYYSAKQCLVLPPLTWTLADNYVLPAYAWTP